MVDDGRTPDHGHPISSPCEPNGSGELIIIFPKHATASRMYLDNYRIRWKHASAALHKYHHFTET